MVAEVDRAPDGHTWVWAEVPIWLRMADAPPGLPGCPAGLMVWWGWRMWVGGPWWQPIPDGEGWAEGRG